MRLSRRFSRDFGLTGAARAPLCLNAAANAEHLVSGVSLLIDNLDAHMVSRVHVVKPLVVVWGGASKVDH